MRTIFMVAPIALAVGFVAVAFRLDLVRSLALGCVVGTFAGTVIGLLRVRP